MQGEQVFVEEGTKFGKNPEEPSSLLQVLALEKLSWRLAPKDRVCPDYA